MKKLICLVVVFVLIFSCSITYVQGTGSPIEDEKNFQAEEKVHCTATLEDNFADDSIILVLSNSASLKFKDYGASDFPEVACSSVSDLTSYTTAYTKEQAITEKQRSADADIELTLSEKQVFSEYNKILLLTLEEKGKQNVLDAISKLEAREDVLSVEPNYIMELASVTPNDRYYGSQYACEKIGLPDAWSETTGSSSIYVGVVDSGIDASHPDLQGRVDIGLSRTFFNGVEATPTTVTDNHGHGTMVAGIIGAASNNNLGVSGVCWNTKLVSLQISNNENPAYIANIIKAIEYATNSLRVTAVSDIRVLNISYGTTNAWYRETILAFETAVTNYGRYGGIIVCSAGNNGINTDVTLHKPSCYTTEHYNLISVGATDRYDRFWTVSNYGVETVDILAPGVDILTCYPTSKCSEHEEDADNCRAPGYHYADGTSLAAPYVTGTVALMFAANPNLAIGDVKSCINVTAHQYANLADKCVSGGRLDVYAAVLEAIARDYT